MTTSSSARRLRSKLADVAVQQHCTIRSARYRVTPAQVRLELGRGVVDARRREGGQLGQVDLPVPHPAATTTARSPPTMEGAFDE
jgi:hypothetical protein